MGGGFDQSTLPNCKNCKYRNGTFRKFHPDEWQPGSQTLI